MSKRNPWLEHVDAYRRAHPGISYKDALKGGQKTYVKNQENKKLTQEEIRGIMINQGQTLPELCHKACDKNNDPVPNFGDLEPSYSNFLQKFGLANRRTLCKVCSTPAPK